jgi:hypothetical protein
MIHPRVRQLVFVLVSMAALAGCGASRPSPTTSPLGTSPSAAPSSAAGTPLASIRLPSPSPAAWLRTQLPIPPGAAGCGDNFQFTNLHPVAFGGGLVLVGSTCHAVGPSYTWVSTDGHAWTAATPKALANADIYGVIAMGNILLAYGSETPSPRYGYAVAAWTSHDGLMWTRSTSDLGGGVMNQAVAFEGRFVAFGNLAPEVPEWPGPYGLLEWTSNDGVSWSAVPISSEVFPKTAIVAALAVEGTSVVAAGPSGSGDAPSAWQSEDGRSWTGPTPLAGPAGQRIDELYSSGVGLIGLGADANGRALIWTSADGTSWSGAAAPGEGALYFEPSLAVESGLVAFAGYPVNATPSPASVWVSADGRTWRLTADLPTDLYYVAIGEFGGTLEVAGSTNDGHVVLMSLAP